ncbi:MAG: inorganic diphosphatase [candidate division Zixibacteria bacterium]|nr:inorganic diphosphatase [candidate division Zixibacteria bacterium]NIR67790.1 inorganic diphosphatase [candidate division Zixibacteria bacterium]NIS17025.1 inorganic diphosphatase [candidate division Zixibacteria bacterium]NIS49022.1 inorganic diphosphatase [candidate division Zixibacteria bacterium]NIT53398.1 inorganic diphosphatase [candidate division Zixibacteria bacterium]
MDENNKKNRLEVIIEIPMGSRNKYEFDKESGHIKFDRMLFSAVHYPSDYGFIPSTLAEDGDPLDALVLVTEPTFPGCHIDCYPIGLFKMEDEKGIDHKILCVPSGDPNWNNISGLENVPEHLLMEIENFFEIYKKLENKKTIVEGWREKSEALTVIQEAKSRFKNSK